MTVAQIDREMSAKEFTEWMYYHSIEPFGGAREDYRAALQASVTANVNGAKIKPEELIKPWNYQEELEARTEHECGDRLSSTQKSQITLFKALGAQHGK